MCPDPVFVSVSDRLFTATVLATGIAELHVCFLRVNLPFCTQITREIHSRNTHVKKNTRENTRKFSETESKILPSLRVIVRVKFYTRGFVCKSAILHAIYTRVKATMPVTYNEVIHVA